MDKWHAAGAASSAEILAKRRGRVSPEVAG